MAQCVYCGTETRLYVNGWSVCVGCEDKHTRANKTFERVKFTDRAFPTPDQLLAARCVRLSVQNGIAVSQANALILRLWAGPTKGVLPLDEIAREMLSVDGGSSERPTHI